MQKVRDEDGEAAEAGLMYKWERKSDADEWYIVSSLLLCFHPSITL